MIESQLVERPELDGYDLYLFVQDGGSRIPVLLNRDPDGVPSGYFCLEPAQRAAHGVALPRTLHLTRETYAAFRSAFIADVIDSDDATRDARATRDRLLTLIEGLVPEAVGPRR